MTRRTVGPRRSDSLPRYVRSTRIIGGLSVLVLSGAVVWDLADDGFWSRHALFTGLVASSIVVAVTAAVLNEVLERRQRQRWSVLAQYGRGGHFAAYEAPAEFVAEVRAGLRALGAVSVF